MKMRLSRTRTILVFLGLLAVASAAQAAPNVHDNSTSKSWEFWTGSLASVNVISSAGNTYSVAGILSGPTGFAVSPAVGYLVGNGLEITFSPTFYESTVSGVNTNLFQPLLGFMYNFGSPVENSAFVQVQVGMTTTINSGVSTSAFTYGVELGKRFQVSEDICYSPLLQYTNIARTTPLIDWAVVPLQFSFFL